MGDIEETVTVNGDGTIDWEVKVPPEIQRMVDEYEESLNAEVEADAEAKAEKKKKKKKKKK